MKINKAQQRDYFEEAHEDMGRIDSGIEVIGVNEPLKSQEEKVRRIMRFQDPVIIYLENGQSNGTLQIIEREKGLDNVIKKFIGNIKDLYEEAIDVIDEADELISTSAILLRAIKDICECNIHTIEVIDFKDGKAILGDTTIGSVYNTFHDTEREEVSNMISTIEAKLEEELK